MSGGSFTDPQVFDFSASTGSIEIDTGSLTTYYFKLTNIPDYRRFNVTMTAGTALLTNTWSQWYAYTTFFAPNFHDTVGGYYPYDPTQSFFYPGGVDVIVKVQLDGAGPGTFTWAWTSVDEPHEPYSWYDPKPLALPSSATFHPSLGHTSNRFFTLHPTTTDPITVTTNEPDGYYEVYRETGVTTFDEYVEDGSNDASGTPTDVLSFVPVAGETYYVSLYTNADDADYTVTATSETLTPPPYVVTNDPWTAPTDVTLNAATGSFDYDNTGATTDVGDPSNYFTNAKRSIYYELQRLDTTQWLHLTANPGISDPSAIPQVWLWQEDPSDPTGWTYIPFLDPDGASLNTKAQAGLKHLLQIHFPASAPASPWDHAGTVTWTLKPIEAYENPETPVALPPGAAGQNTVVNPIFAGTNIGRRYYTITAPVAGSLQVVLEAASQDALDTGYARVTTADGVAFSVPERLAGATTPAAQGITVTAGETVKVETVASAGPVMFRWGMSTEVATWHDWHSAGWSDAADPLGAAGIRSWPRQWSSGYPPGDWVGPVHVQAEVGSRELAKAWIIGSDRLPGFAGRAISGENASWGNSATVPEAYLGGYMLADGAGDWQSASASASTVPLADYIAWDYVNWASGTQEHTPEEKALNRFYYDHLPIIYTANRYGEMPPRTFWPASDVAALKGVAVEWSEPNVERWNRYERIAFGGVREANNGGMGELHYVPDDALDIGLFATPNTAQNWQLSPGGMAGGQLKGQWSVPNVYGWSYSEDPGPLGRESQMTEADVFGGGSPTKGVTVYNDRYNVGISPFEGGVDFDAIRFGVDATGQSFTFFTLGGQASVAVDVRRVYPNLFRLGIYAENLEPIEAPTPPALLPGSFLHPNPNLDGQGTGVEVAFQ